MRALIIDPGLQHKSKANSIPAKRIPVWAILLMLISTALFSSLGTWQLGRAEEKRAIFAAYAQGTAEAMREGLSGVDASEQRYQLLRLQGHYDTGHQLLLDNMSHAGQSGYHVLTPFITAGGSVLVNRGWVPADGDRRLLPNIDVSSQPRTLTGRIDRLPQPALRLAPATDYTGMPWPRRLLFPTTAEVSAQTGYPLRDFQLLLNPAEADGFLRDWRPALMTPETHLGYAIQWFGLAATAVVVFVILAWRHLRTP
ncbi:MAG: SURF1 family protein [Gammaproteobacteria bacterium]